jgi:hypothetical protein
MAPPVRKKASTGLPGPLSANLTVRGDCNDLSPNIRLHWAVREKRVSRWRQAAAHEARQLGWPVVDRRVRLTWHIRRGRPLDAANIHGSGCLKAYEDGLVDAGIVPDDKPKWVEWGLVTQENGKQWAGTKAEVICKIEELPSG